MTKQDGISNGEWRRAKMFAIRNSIFAILLIFLNPPSALAQEPLKELELRLQVIQANKQIAAADFERGQLLIQNAQMRFKALSEEEAALVQKIAEIKEVQGSKLKGSKPE